MNVNPEEDMLDLDDFMPVIEDDEIITTDESNDEDELEEDNIEDESDDDNDDNIPETDDVALGTFKTLVEKGILADDEEFDGTWDSLEDRFNKLPEQIADNIIQNIPKPGQKLMEYMFSKENLTHDDLKEYFGLIDEDSKSTVEINTLDDARAFIMKDYQSKGLDDDAIEAALDAMEDKGDDYLIDKAKQLNESLSKNKESKANAELEKIKEQKRLNEENAQKLYNSINEEFKTLNYKESRINAIKTNLRSDVLQEKNNYIRQSPKALIQLADFYSYFDKDTGTFDLTAYAAQAQSKQTTKKKNKLIKDNFNSTSLGKRSKPQTNDDELIPIF